jgi:beta-alanine degradation protein BauB
MVRIVVLAAAILLALLRLVTAQDRGATVSGVYKSLLDNDRVRVLQANFKPGDKVDMRTYPNHLMYAVTDGTLVFIPAGRTGYEVNFKAGEALWFPPLARATENDSDQEVRVLLVEFKEGAARTAAARSAKTKAKGKGKARPRGKGAAKAKTPAKK